METRGVSPPALALAAAAGAYLSARPGVAAGAVDYYISDRVARATAVPYGPDDVIVGRKIAAGGFGSVYRATLAPRDGGAPPRPVILKKASEFGPAEAWMNERAARAAPTAVAPFIAAFDEAPPPSSSAARPDRRGAAARLAAASAADGGPLWLLWEDEGPDAVSLFAAMGRRDFPYCVEPLLFGRDLRLAKGARRRAATLAVLARHLLESLDALHAIGIVHRDVKPQNVLLSPRGGRADGAAGNGAPSPSPSSGGRAKLIDLGAAADLRVGVNYIPNELLLDPRFAPPERYIMSRLTPRAPPPALAAALSPVLWALERPDKFDVYSLGVTLLQAAFGALRSDGAIVAFRKKLKALDHDIDAWAATARASRDYADGWEVLDLDGGAAWALVRELLAADPTARPSARRALRSAWMAGSASSSSASSASSSVASGLAPVAAAVARAGAGVAAEIGRAVDRDGDGGGVLSEAWLRDQLEDGGDDDGYDDEVAARPSQTIAWWRGRQAALGRKKGGGGGAKAKAAKAAPRPPPPPPREAVRLGLPELPRLPWGK
jgi:serine/threonine protein kinase